MLAGKRFLKAGKWVMLFGLVKYTIVTYMKTYLNIFKADDLILKKSQNIGYLLTDELERTNILEIKGENFYE